MVSSTRQAIAGILIIFSAAVLARAQTVQPKEPTATITGKITIKGKGAPGIFITLRRQESSFRRQLTGLRAVTDNEGKYRIENITAGSYVVIPVAPAYVWYEDASERTLIINKAETIENIDFTLVIGGAITGKLTDADGRLLIEEDVVAVPEPGNQRAQGRFLNSTTDDRGIYRIFGLPRGRYRVAAGRESYSRYQRNSFKQTFYPGVEDMAQATVIDVTEGSETINIDLTLGRITTYTASGRILDGQTGKPLPRVGYAVTRYIEHGSSSTGYDTLTNSRGEFRLENLSPGKYGVAMQDRTGSGEWRAEEVLFEIIDQDVTGLVVKTEKSASVSGVVVIEGPEDKSVREQLTKMQLGIGVMNDPSSHRGYGSSTTPAQDGSFRITGLGGGTASFSMYSTNMFHIVRVERNGVVLNRTFQIKPSEQLTDFRIFVTYSNASIRGVITLANGKMPADGRFFVWLKKLGEDPNTPELWTDASRQMDSRGQFIIENLTAGTYELHAGIAVTGTSQVQFNKKQEVVVAAGSTNNINVTLDLSQPAPKP
jgi:hypothetical protein